eukprot:121231_1
MDVTFDLTELGSVGPTALDIDWSNFHHPLDLFVEPICDDLIPCDPSEHHHSNADATSHDQMSEIVKQQLAVHHYAKIGITQQTAAQQHSHHLISSIISSSLRNTVPSAVFNLMCTYYPLFYWNSDYISLQASDDRDSQIFIIHKEYCKLSELLSSHVQNTSTSASTLIVQNIRSDVLELFVKYLVNMQSKQSTPHHHHMDDTDHALFRMMCGDWDAQFIDSLDHETVSQLLAAAQQMKCESLVDLAQDQLVLLSDNAPQNMEDEGGEYTYTHCNVVQSILDSHFRSLQSDDAGADIRH